MNYSSSRQAASSGSVSKPSHISDIISPIAMAIELTLVLLNVFPVIVVIFYKRRPRSRLAVDELILALSLTEIVGVLVPAPLGFTAYFSGEWKGGEIACNFYQVTIVWLQLTSMCLVTFMCADRYVAAKNCVHCKPPSAASFSRIRISIAVIFLFALSVSVLPLFHLAPRALSSSGHVCRSWITSHPDTLHHDDVREHVFYIAYLTVGYANVTIALMVNISLIINLCAARSVLSNLEPCSTTCRGDRSAEDHCGTFSAQYDCRNSIELSITVAVVTAFVYLSWLPVLVLVTMQKAYVSLSDEMLFYAVLGASLSGLANPVLYAALSRSYRHGYTHCLTSIVKFIFGCPISRNDVISDISSQAQRIRSSRNSSTATSVALLRDDSRAELRPSYALTVTGETEPVERVAQSSNINDPSAKQWQQVHCGPQAEDNEQPTLIDLSFTNTASDKTCDILNVNINADADSASENDTCSTSDEDDDDVSLGSYEEDQRETFLRMQGIPCANDMGMSHINTIFD